MWATGQPHPPFGSYCCFSDPCWKARFLPPWWGTMAAPTGLWTAAVFPETSEAWRRRSGAGPADLTCCSHSRGPGAVSGLPPSAHPFLPAHTPSSLLTPTPPCSHPLLPAHTLSCLCTPLSAACLAPPDNSDGVLQSDLCFLKPLAWLEAPPG